MRKRSVEIWLGVAQCDPALAIRRAGIGLPLDPAIDNHNVLLWALHLYGLLQQDFAGAIERDDVGDSIAFAGHDQLPAGLHREWLPASSPELQPAERLWPLTNEPLANRAFADLAALDAVLADQCVRLAEQPARVRAQTLFHWWPRLAPMPESFIRT